MNRQMEIEKLATETTNDPSLAVARREGQGIGWEVLLFGQDNGGVLPSVLCRSPRAPKKTSAFIRQPRQQRKQASEPANDASRLASR